MLHRRPIIAISLLVFMTIACEENGSEPIPPSNDTFVDSLTFTSCEITYQGIVLDRAYLERQWQLDGTVDTLFAGVLRDTLRSAVLVFPEVDIEGFILTGSFRQSGFDAGMPWDSARTCRAEFDPLTGRLLSLMFTNGGSKRVVSPGGLDLRSSLSMDVRGQGFTAPSEGISTFIWQGPEELNRYFYRFVSDTRNSSPDWYESVVTQSPALEAQSKVSVRFR